MAWKHADDDLKHLRKAVLLGNMGNVMDILKRRSVQPDAALLKEAYSGRLDIFIAIVEAGAPCEGLLNERFDDLLPLPSQRNCCVQLEVLIKHSRLNNIRPSLLFRCLGVPSVVKLLLEHGADPNCVDNHRTPLIQTLLSTHIHNEQIIATVTLLLDADADAHVVLMRDASTWTRTLLRGYNLLHIASEMLLPAELVRSFISAGVDLDAVVQGRTPLTLALGRNHDQVVSLLLEAKANPNAGSPSPLNVAITMQSVNSCIALLWKGADARRVDFDGWSRHKSATTRAILALILIFGGTIPRPTMAAQIALNGWTAANAEQRLILNDNPLKTIKLR